MGKSIIVTGAAGGIGRVIASELARQGAVLSLIGRRLQPLRELRDSLPAPETFAHRVSAFDVASNEHWEAFRASLGRDSQIHGLVLAAGVLGPVGAVGTWTIDAFRSTIESNLIGTLAPIVTLLDALSLARGSVVTFSGGGATSPLPRYDAYAVSKTAVVRLTENLSVDLFARGVRINAVAPGFVVTDIHRGTLEAGRDAAGPEYYELTAEALEAGRRDPPENAAELTTFLLSDEAAGITGRLISARWDPWRDPSFRNALRSNPHLATLRRIDDQFFTSTSKE